MKTGVTWKGPVWPLGLVAVACGGVDAELSLQFPNETTKSLTTLLAATVFQPVLPASADGPARFVSCDEVGAFAPTRGMSPVGLPTALKSERFFHAYPLDGGFELKMPTIPEDDGQNPWGVVMVHLEARGPKVPGQAGEDAASTQPLLDACYCFRLHEGGAAGQEALHRAVTESCPILEANEPVAKQVVALNAFAPSSFRLSSACGDGPQPSDYGQAPRLTLVEGARSSPGAEVCVNTSVCGTVATGDCFACGGSCGSLKRDVEPGRSNLPILFSIQRGDGRVSTQVQLTDREGRARPELDVEECDGIRSVSAGVVGRPDPEVVFQVDCVDALGPFECQDDIELEDRQSVVSLTRIPGALGEADQVAVLVDDDGGAELQVFNPMASEAVASFRFPNERGAALHGFFYDLGVDGIGERPVVAVATSPDVDRTQVFLYVFEWVGGMLRPHDGATGLLEGDCATWSCGSRTPCVSECSSATEACSSTPNGNVCVEVEKSTSGCESPPPVRCACRLRLTARTRVILRSADLDRDGKSDLAALTSAGTPLNIYYSGLVAPDAQALYNGTQGCQCSLLGSKAEAFDVVNLGGDQTEALPASRAVVFGLAGAAGRTFVRYPEAMQEGPPLIRCAGAEPFGAVRPVRDIVRGHFQCHPFRPERGCSPFEDVVILTTFEPGGGVLTDPGVIRVIFGASRDIHDFGDVNSVPGATLSLLPLSTVDEFGVPIPDPVQPSRLNVRDLNGDGHDDLAVLFFGGFGERTEAKKKRAHVARGEQQGVGAGARWNRSFGVPRKDQL